MKKVIIYTSSTCTYCHVAKKYFTEKNVEFEERNTTVDSNYQDELAEMGYRAVPVILVDDEVVVGFNKEKIDELLGL